MERDKSVLVNNYNSFLSIPSAKPCIIYIGVYLVSVCDFLTCIRSGVKLKPIYACLGNIKAGAFSLLSGCEALWLWNNRIREVRGDMWVGLESLLELSFSHNHITTIHPGGFTNLPHINKLWLNSNRLNSLPINMFSQGSCPFPNMYFWMHANVNSVTKNFYENHSRTASE